MPVAITRVLHREDGHCRSGKRGTTAIQTSCPVMDRFVTRWLVQPVVEHGVLAYIAKEGGKS